MITSQKIMLILYGSCMLLPCLECSLEVMIIKWHQNLQFLLNLLFTFKIIVSESGRIFFLKMVLGWSPIMKIGPMATTKWLKSCLHKGRAHNLQGQWHNQGQTINVKFLCKILRHLWEDIQCKLNYSAKAVKYAQVFFLLTHDCHSFHKLMIACKLIL